MFGQFVSNKKILVSDMVPGCWIVWTYTWVLLCCSASVFSVKPDWNWVSSSTRTNWDSMLNKQHSLHVDVCHTDVNDLLYKEEIKQKGVEHYNTD